MTALSLTSDQGGSRPPSAAPRPGVVRWILLAKLCSLLALGAAVVGYFVAGRYADDLDLAKARIVWMVTAVVVATYLTLSMASLDRPLVSARLAWWLRWTLKLSKRVLLVLQIAVLAVGALVAFKWALALKVPIVP